MGNIFFADDIFKPQKPIKPKPLTEIKNILCTPLNSEKNHYGDSENCECIVKSWFCWSRKVEAYQCNNCFKIFEIRSR